MAGVTDGRLTLRTTFIAAGLALTVLLLPALTGQRSVSAYYDTHYGYDNWITGHLAASSNNTCDLVSVGSTFIGVYMDQEPGSVASCLQRKPNIVGVMLKTRKYVSRNAVEGMFLKSWTGSSPARWRDLPSQFPNVNFVMEVGNEPDLTVDVHPDPWNVGWYQNDTINYMKTAYSSISNLYYAAALGTGSTCVKDLNDNNVCYLDYVRAQVEGQKVCQTGWGCTIHQYWDDDSGYSSVGPTFWRNLLPYVQGSIYVPRVGVSEQGIWQSGTPFSYSRDCTLRNYTGQYPSKVRFTLTYTVAHPTDGPEPAYWVKYRSQICY